MPSEEERGKEEEERPRRAHLVDGKTQRKPASPLKSHDLNFSLDGAEVGQIYVSVHVCVVPHLICRCFEFRMGHPLNRCATDGHCFRDLSWSKEQLAVFPTPSCACLNLISLISMFVWVCACVCPWLPTHQIKNKTKQKTPAVNKTTRTLNQNGYYSFKVRHYIQAWNRLW